MYLNGKRGDIDTYSRGSQRASTRDSKSISMVGKAKFTHMVFNAGWLTSKMRKISTAENSEID